MKRKKLKVEERSISIPLISFFTGGGLLDIGFAKAGFEIVWANEINSAFADMYEFAISSMKHTFRNGKVLERISDRRSIEDIGPKEIIKNAFPKERPELFGIIGGPPCPDFSNGGKHRGHEGDHGRLSKIFAEYICAIKPPFFVFENVHGLLRTKKHRIFLESLEKQLRDANYSIDRTVLNSLDFGLAQDRERVFLIGLNKNLAKYILRRKITSFEKNWFPWPIGKFKDAKKRFAWPKINENGKTPLKPAGIPDELMVFHLLFNIPEDLSNAKEGFQPHSKKFQMVREGDTSGKSFKRLHRYRYSPTACYGNNEVHLHPWENRRLSVREVMRIQGVPDYYLLPQDVFLTDKFKMIANGVPIPLAEQVAKSLYTLLMPLEQ